VPDFVSTLATHLPEISAAGIRVVANAGGVNVQGCADAVRAAVSQAGLSLTVVAVEGDDLMDRLDRLDGKADMFSGEAFPNPDHIVSANAYLGAFPIADALSEGADIVVTGRVVDSAVTLGPLIHEFGWGADDLDRLAGGSLAGHLLECGPQVTGGNFTDWRDVPDLAGIGYPIAEVTEDGACTITKPAGTGGVVNRGTVAEQMLYEIGDPAEYFLPDVVCDFTQVVIEETGPNRVHVSGARGRGRPGAYKASVTVADGFRLSALFFMVGPDAEDKARTVFDAVMTRARAKLSAMGLPDYTHTAFEPTGTDFHFGGHGRSDDALEIAFRLCVRHPDAEACALVLREASGFGLATPPGLFLFSGARPRPQPVVRLMSTLIDKVALSVPALPAIALSHVSRETPAAPGPTDTSVPLSRLAWLRSGDKGDHANIGVAARKPEFMPYIWSAVTEAAVQERFAHLAEGEVTRWYLPGSQSMNLLMERALGGGGMASLRNDAQGKGFGQVLSIMPIPVPASLL
ncbi:MAG: acyclic terpene utilization AtuA family protein, partial [Litorimonas sp.]